MEFGYDEWHSEIKNLLSYKYSCRNKLSETATKLQYHVDPRFFYETGSTLKGNMFRCQDFKFLP
jgi:hypothetical protein